MGLDQIVNELVCRDVLFSFLDVNDLLRLRRVSKSVKNMAQDYIRSKKVQTSQVLDIDLRHMTVEDEENDDQFQNTSNYLPTRTNASFWFRLQRDQKSALGQPLQSFLERCAATITHLTIHNLKIPIYSETMLQFFESFPSVTSLGLTNVQGDEAADSTPTCKIPTTFKNIKELKITSHDWCANTLGFLVQLLDTCIANLETFALPRPSVGWDVRGLQERFVAGGSREQVAHFYRTIFTAPNLKLADVDGDSVRKIIHICRQQIPELGTIHGIADSLSFKVISLENPNMLSFRLELPNLEKIEIESIDKFTLPNPGSPMRDWPKLKEIKVKLADDIQDRDYLPQQALSLEVWNILFVGIRRENVVKLDIEFGCINNEHTFAAADVSTSCPYLKILRLGEKLSTLQDIPRFWRELIHLEELCFAHCKDLTDEVLVGEDAQNPAIWNLKNLKVLKLMGLGKMKITDGLFKNVLCHMPLKKLALVDYSFQVTTVSLPLEDQQ